MAVVTILCPRTGRQVSTGLEIAPSEFKRLREAPYSFHCWLCGSEHSWTKRWATLADADPQGEERRAQALLSG